MRKLIAALIISLSLQSSTFAQLATSPDYNLEFIQDHRRFLNSSVVAVAIADALKAWDLVSKYGERFGSGRIVMFQELPAPIPSAQEQTIGFVDIENINSVNQWCKAGDSPTLFWLHHSCALNCVAFVNAIKKCLEIYTAADASVPFSVVASGRAINILGESYSTCCYGSAQQTKARC